MYAVYYVLNMVINGIGEWPATNDWYGFLNWGIGPGAVITAAAFGITYLIGLVLRNARGEVLDFGAIPADRLPMARIHSLKADKGHYQEGEEAVFQVAAAVEQRPAELRWRLEDAHGRVVHEGRATAENAVSFRVPVRSGVPSRHYRCVCEMIDIFRPDLL